MFEKILLSVSMLFFVACGGGSTTSSNTTPTETPIIEEPQTTPEESIPKELTNVEKVTKESEALNLLVTPVNGVVNVISGENKTSFNKELYALKDDANQWAIISIGSSSIEELESKEGLILKSQDIVLPNFHKGYRNIFIDTNSTDIEIKEELILLFEDGGVPVMSYIPSNLENNSTIKIEGDSNIFSCSNNNKNYEIIAREGLVTLPSDKDGHYLCLDQHNNQAFDYNVSIEKIEEVLGSLYTYDPKKTQGTLVKIYDMIFNQINIADLESRFKESNLLSEDGSLKLEIFYKNENSTEDEINTVKGREYLLEEGTYLLSFLITSPQNTNINQKGDLSPIKVITKTTNIVIIPN